MRVEGLKFRLQSLGGACASGQRGRERERERQERERAREGGREGRGEREGEREGGWGRVGESGSPNDTYIYIYMYMYTHIPTYTNG